MINPIDCHHTAMLSTHRSAHSLRGFYFLLGLMSGTWIALIPALRLQWGLDMQELGLVLLATGVGAFSVYPIAHHGLPRLGSARMCLLSVPLLALAVGCLAWAPVLWTFVVAMYLAGAAAGLVDSAINSQAVVQEAAGQRSLMSGMHGFYSVGNLMAGGWVSLATLSGMSPKVQLSAVALVALVVPWQIGRYLVSAPAPQGESDVLAGKVPWNWALVMLGGLIISGYVLEGSLLDWSGVYLQTQLGARLAQAPWGFMAFSVAMVIGRLMGDRVIQAWGAGPTLTRAGALATVAMVVSLTVPHLGVVVVAYGVVGMGMSVVVPILFSLSGRLNPGDGGRTVAKVAMIGYAGVLGGPALLGYLAHHISLRVALAVLALLAVSLWRWGNRAARLVEQGPKPSVETLSH